MLTLSHNENKVTRLSNDFYSTSAIYTGNPWIRGQSGQTSHIVEEGRSLGNFYNLKYMLNMRSSMWQYLGNDMMSYFI